MQLVCPENAMHLISSFIIGCKSATWPKKQHKTHEYYSKESRILKKKKEVDSKYEYNTASHSSSSKEGEFG